MGIMNSTRTSTSECVALLTMLVLFPDFPLKRIALPALIDFHFISVVLPEMDSAMAHSPVLFHWERFPNCTTAAAAGLATGVSAWRGLRVRKRRGRSK